MRWLLIALGMAAGLAGCERHEAKPQARGPVEVTVERIAPRDVPVTYEYVGQTESTRQVQIRARVNGFLEQRVYTEGSLVRAGDVMFRQDPR
ncbi:MAG: efflux transporter periplasmic adaptor subunit, partial [Gammaproteobacteria bacterium]|nr:efflux transporter periplasmic adaptor subunit [Gammaproteobacteria bacterium]